MQTVRGRSMSNSKYQEALDRTKEIYEVICDELKSKELTNKTNEDVEVLQELVDKASAFDKDVDMIEQLIEEHFKLKEKYSKILDDVHDYRLETHCMKMTIRNLCEHFGVKSEKELQNIYLNKPYKLEDLKEDMRVYDIKYDEFCRIDFIAGIYPHRSYSDGTCEDGAFEENRFFPVQYANLIKMEVKK